ncbi:YodC family protein [Flammeovirga sp. OC4]|uniref:YodC family protein n=1 Tax=Flammeovirga sp. OC4 TaxID=1382345 RepID=UPI0005C5E61C|nr:DUF2158 domain-containing protein [Flammeovirga sp. OC4]
MEFSKGDIVQLKSGGPKMTVKGIVGDSVQTLSRMENKAYKIHGVEEGTVICEWFLNNELKSGQFQPEMIIKSE